MKAIGIDIGTTSVGLVTVDAATGEVAGSVTAANRSRQPGRPFENLQDPQWIWAAVQAMLREMLDGLEEPPLCIGITGQMHGILYINAAGEPVSPLYTWQDASGSQPYSDTQNYAQRLMALSGHSPLATGYGAVTHFYHTVTGLVPPGAVAFCTIGDFIGMRLVGAASPRVHPSNAASMGLFAPATGQFDREAIAAAGMNPALFPAVAEGFALLGKTSDGVPVAAAIGDNQASFLGAVREMESSILLNVGTGGQISLATDNPATASPLIEARPNTGSRDFLLVGSALCAGSSYALLEQLFSGVVEMATGERPASLYPAMDRLAENTNPLDEPLRVSTLFRGTRQNPDERASINGISASNFTPQHLIHGVLEGMSREFFDLYQRMNIPPERRFSQLVCSGNGVRRNLPLQKALERLFGMPLRIPAHKEEACYGAALFALVAAGVYPGMHEAQRLIQYSSL